MQLIAITADSAWRAALHTTKTATVESVFHRALNLRLDGGELLSIFPAGSPDAPAGLVSSHGIGQILGGVGETVELSPTAITFNTTTITTNNCQFVSNSLGERQLPMLSHDYLEQFTQHVKAQAIQGSFYGSMPNDVFNSAQVARLERGRGQLKLAWTQSSVEGIADATQQLIGLGIGLTPSGDDYLVGLLLVLNHSVAADSANLAAIKQVILDNLGTTTSVSQAYLRAGLERRYGEPLRDLLIAVTSQADTFENALQTVLSHGATSGQDTCTGMIDAWKLLQGFTTESCYREILQEVGI
ncbi:DUF2877 domain-containing protein [Psychrobacter frigidicola]|uniref:DUF2877 domain-containing protein n=1 Tax=Psychrobacter frigidicola TaxID=45611 RepID=UPI001917FB16|nr:DUF2877 domain-containing protein [Psychrobacter frigidicola]